MKSRRRDIKEGRRNKLEDNSGEREEKESVKGVKNRRRNECFGEKERRKKIEGRKWRIIQKREREEKTIKR